MTYVLSGVQAGWLPTKLLMGDELGSTPGNAVDPSHDLSVLYGISPQAIVQGNGILFDTPSINAWVLQTGGVTLTDGQPVFSNNSVILLPPGGPRTLAGPGLLQPPAAVAEAGVNPVAVLAFGAVALVLLLGGKKKDKHKKGETPKPVTF